VDSVRVSAMPCSQRLPKTMLLHERVELYFELNVMLFRFFVCSEKIPEVEPVAFLLKFLM